MMIKPDSKLITRISKIQELEGRQCVDCLKLTRTPDGTYICSVFLEFYWETPGQKTCPAYVDNPEEWYSVLRQIKEYADKQHLRVPSLEEELRLMEDVVKDLKGEGWEEVYYQDVNRPLVKKGKGEKSDRTHKLFSRQRMKDNRYIPPWEGPLEGDKEKDSS